MFEDLKGQRVLITGASTGIGAAAARGFARCGAAVAVHYNSSADAAEQVAADIRAMGGTAHLVAGDVAQRGVVERVVEEAAQAMGGMDVLINNAGALIGRVRPADWDHDYIDAVFDLNVRQVIMACKAALPYLKERPGTIITTGSIAARNGSGIGAGMYGAAKSWVQNLTRNLTKELASDGIRANAVAPGVILTPFHERYSTAEQLEAMRQTIPMGRHGSPEECVGAFLFLASAEAAGYINGQVIEVNGGQLMP